MWYPPRPSSQIPRAAAPTQNPPDHAAYTQASRIRAFSQMYASTLLGSSFPRPGFDALHSPRQLLPLAPVQNTFDLLSLEDQQHHSRAKVTGSRQMNQSSFTGLPSSAMDSHCSSWPDARHHQSQPSPFSPSPTLPPGVGRHPAAFNAPSLLIPLQPGLSFPSGAHSGLLPAAFPYHRPAQARMPPQPGFKTLDHRFPQVSATRGETTSMGHSSPSPRNISHYSQPHFKQVQGSEPSRQPPYRTITETGFVMWVGNLEGSASLDELYNFFRQVDPMPLPPEQSAVVSIMYMPSTNCALVNMRNEAALREAVEHFHGSRLRPNTKSARLVCRRRGGELGLPEAGRHRRTDCLRRRRPHRFGSPGRDRALGRDRQAVGPGPGPAARRSCRLAQISGDTLPGRPAAGRQRRHRLPEAGI